MALQWWLTASYRCHD